MTFADRSAELAGQIPARFGWTPEQFWNATPAELVAILKALIPPHEAVFDSTLLTALMEQFPDG